MLRRDMAKIAAFTACLLTAALPALAQTPVQRIRGVLVSDKDGMLTVAAREGPTMTIKMADGLKPGALKKIALSDIKPHDFIATVAAPNKNNVLQSVYVIIFPESMRGRGEGHYDWDLAPGTSMTNATVTSAMTARNGRVLSLVYKGTPIEITVPETAPVLAPIPASDADLKPGARVFIVASKAADGSLIAQRVTVGKDGVNPPQ